MKRGVSNNQQAHRGSRMHRAVQIDAWLLIPVLLLAASGLVMWGPRQSLSQKVMV